MINFKAQNVCLISVFNDIKNNDKGLNQKILKTTLDKNGVHHNLKKERAPIRNVLNELRKGAVA